MKYSIIYADPPWQYRDKCHSGNRGVEYKYETLTIEEIKRLNVSSLAAADCTLFLWVTMPMLQEGLNVIQAWGFNYKTVAFNWIKTTKNGKLFWGMGSYTRSNGELCLIAIKGKPKRISAGVHSVITSRHEGHSKKPDIARELIVEVGCNWTGNRWQRQQGFT